MPAPIDVADHLNRALNAKRPRKRLHAPLGLATETLARHTMNDNDAITKRPGQHAGPVTLAIRAVRQLMPWESDGSIEGEQRAAIWEARRTIMDVKDRSELEQLAAAAMHGPRELAEALAAWNRRYHLGTYSDRSRAMDQIFGNGAHETDPYPIAFTSVFQGLAAGNLATQ